MRRVTDGILSGSLLVTSCLSLVGCNNAPGPKFSSTEMIQQLSGVREPSIRCHVAENADAAECKLVRERLAKVATGDKFYYLSGGGSLIGIDFADRVVVILEPVANSAGVQWKCSVSPLEANPKACDVLH